MNRIESAWKLSATGTVVLLLAGGVTFVSLALNWMAFGAGRAQIPDLNWINAASPVILFALIAWLSWSMFTELRALHRQQQDLAKFSLVANKTDHAVVITNRDGLIEWVNEGFTRISGHKLVEVVNKPPGSVLLGPLQNPRAIQKIRDGLSQHKNFSLEVLCSHKNGHRYWLSLSFTPVFNEEEEVVNYIIVGADLTARKRTEEELARVNRRNELLLHAAGDGICGLDLQGHISFVNPAASRFTGWPPSELTGRPVTFILHQLRRPKALSVPEDLFLTAAFKDGSVSAGDGDLFKRKDGSAFPVEYTSTPVREGSNLVGAVVVFRDISERKQTENLRSRQARQFALRADIAMALTTGEALGNILQRSAQAVAKHLDGCLARIWTHNAEENVLELQASAGLEVKPDNVHRRVEIGELTVGRVARERVPQITNDLLRQSAPIERDWLKRERMISFAGFPLLVEGRSVGILAVYSRKPLPEDAIELLGSVADSIGQGIVRKRTEEKVAEQAALLDKAQDAILVIDLSDRVIYWNKSAERLYGWPAAEAYGKKVNELIFRDTAYFERAKKEALGQGEWRGELCQVNRGDEPVIVESQWTLVHEDLARPKCILILNTDISERRKMEAQFFRTQRMDSIGTLAGGIAHDLNNVLAPILMSVAMLKERFKDDQSRRMLTILESSAKRGADMVKQVLTFARGVEGERVLLQTKHLIKELAKIASETFPKNVQIKTNVSEQLWTILGDATQLHQVLLNLSVNARDAMPNGGTLTISAENTVLEQIPEHRTLKFEAKPGFYVLIKVADSGTGIPPEILDKIFEPFFTTKEMGKGTGLGLSTVLGIVKSHGGFVEVQTEVNKGTTFLIYLPASENPQSQPVDNQPKELPSGRGELLLVVDDEAAVLSMTKETLETFGYKVLAAKDGTEAVAAFTAHRNEIKAVITDMIMPHMDGPATIRVIKKLDPQARVIAASGLMDGEKVKDATGLDKIEFLMKPYTAEKLLNTVHTVLNDPPLG